MATPFEGTGGELSLGGTTIDIAKWNVTSLLAGARVVVAPHMNGSEILEIGGTFYVSPQMHAALKQALSAPKTPVMHPTEKCFLDAMEKNPEDDTARLVYADWLDENGDAEKAEWMRAVSPVVQDECLSGSRFATLYSGLTVSCQWRPVVVIATQGRSRLRGFRLEFTSNSGVCGMRLFRTRDGEGDSEKLFEDWISPGAWLLHQMEVVLREKGTLSLWSKSATRGTIAYQVMIEPVEQL